MGVARACALPDAGRMRTLGRGRVEAAWGTYSRRQAKEKACLVLPALVYRPPPQVAQQSRRSELVIKYFIRLGKEFHQYSSF